MRKRVTSGAKKKPNKLTGRPALPTNQKLPFMEHVIELRKRVMYAALSVGLFGVAAYSVEHHIVAALLKPAHGQQFIYTSPGGGLNFLFQLCLYVGIACSIPVIVWQVLKYLEPLIRQHAMRFIVRGSLASGILAAAGVVFGYFIGLPAALHFLLHQFVTAQIHPLLTIQSYMSFVLVYMLGSALLLQIPLILLFINRIKPLKPSKLVSFKVERWVIVAALVGGAIMNPNPNPFAQAIVVVPLLLMYQLGAAIVWWVNRRSQPSPRALSLLQQDIDIQRQRLEQFYAARSSLEQRMVAHARAQRLSAGRLSVSQLLDN